MKHVITLFCFLFLAGCSNFVHVRRDITLDQALSSSCFENALQSKIPTYKLTALNDKKKDWKIESEEDHCGLLITIYEKTLTIEHEAVTSSDSVKTAKDDNRKCMDKITDVVQKECAVRVLKTDEEENK